MHSPPRRSARDELLRKRLGTELQVLRVRRGVSRQQLSCLLATNAAMQTLAAYEAGQRVVTIDRLFELCDALKEDPVQLIARVQHLVTVDRAGDS